MTRSAKKTTAICAALAVLIALALAFRWWKVGTPYQARFVSPNGQYYVQKFSNLSWSRLVAAGPGQGGSDRVDGYIRLFDRDGRLLAERFVQFSRDVEPVWADRQVFLRGVPEMDEHPWILPSPAN